MLVFGGRFGRRRFGFCVPFMFAVFVWMIFLWVYVCCVLCGGTPIGAMILVYVWVLGLVCLLFV